jgi:transketolase
MTDLALLAAAVLRHLRGDPADPHWPDRDRLLLCSDAAAALTPAFAPALATEIPGPPGLAFGTAVGMALAERQLTARFGRSLVDHRVFLLAGPAELASGTSHEAAALAGALPLGRLTVLAALPASETRALARFTALGWIVRHVADPRPEALDAALAAAQRAQKPTLIVGPAPAHAAIAAHGATPAGNEAALHHAATARRAWLKRLRRHTQSESFHTSIAGRPTLPWPALAPPDAPRLSPVEIIAAALTRLAPLLPDLLLLPPDDVHPPTEPNGLKHIAWAGRATAAAAALLGAALHGGLLPIGRFSLRDADTLRPAVRAAAALNQRGVYLVAESGLACPVGGLRAGWRAMRNLLLLRPADAAEAAECFSLALRRTAGPSMLLLSPEPTQTLPNPSARACARGAYPVIDPPHRDLTLIAAGPELHLAVALHAALAAEGIHAAIISLPCWTLFGAQEQNYRAAILGTAPRIGLESGSGAGWLQWLGPDGLFIDTEGTTDAATLLPAIHRRLARPPASNSTNVAVLETSENLLESGATID